MEDNNNKPGSREMNLCWIDSAGKLMLYGGIPPFEPTKIGYSYADLWSYNISTNQWTWVQGDTGVLNQAIVYGSKNFGSPSTIPGNRNLVASWTNKSGVPYLFGGNGYSPVPNVKVLNDMWKLDLPAGASYSFTGNGDWTNAGNWASGQIPPNPIPTGSTVNINPIPGGSCIFNGTLFINHGVLLNIPQRVVFIINGNVVYQ